VGNPVFASVIKDLITIHIIYTFTCIIIHTNLCKTMLTYSKPLTNFTAIINGCVFPITSKFHSIVIMFISALWYLGCRFDKHNSLMTNFAFSKKFMKHSCKPYSKSVSTFRLMNSKHYIHKNHRLFKRFIKTSRIFRK
jgi:hypothetical protein